MNFYFDEIFFDLNDDKVNDILDGSTINVQKLYLLLKANDESYKNISEKLMNIHHIKDITGGERKRRGRTERQRDREKNNNIYIAKTNSGKFLIAYLDKVISISKNENLMKKHGFRFYNKKGIEIKFNGIYPVNQANILSEFWIVSFIKLLLFTAEYKDILIFALKVGNLFTKFIKLFTNIYLLNQRYETKYSLKKLLADILDVESNGVTITFNELIKTLLLPNLPSMYQLFYDIYVKNKQLVEVTEIPSNIVTIPNVIIPYRPSKKYFFVVYRNDFKEVVQQKIVEKNLVPSEYKLINLNPVYHSVKNLPTTVSMINNYKSLISFDLEDYSVKSYVYRRIKYYPLLLLHNDLFSIFNFTSINNSHNIYELFNKQKEYYGFTISLLAPPALSHNQGRGIETPDKITNLYIEDSWRNRTLETKREFNVDFLEKIIRTGTDEDLEPMSLRGGYSIDNIINIIKKIT